MSSADYVDERCLALGSLVSFVANPAHCWKERGGERERERGRERERERETENKVGGEREDVARVVKWSYTS